MRPPTHPDPRSDVILVQLAAKGDTLAFAALFNRHKDYAMRLAIRFSGDHEVAADVVQETFIYLLRKLPTLTLTAKLTTYLYPIVKNVAFTARRKERPTLRLVGQEDDEGPGSAKPPERPTVGAFEAVVNRLPEHQREVLLLRFVDDMSMEEISTAAGIPVGTVKSRLHLAIKALREDPETSRAFDIEGLGGVGGAGGGVGRDGAVTPPG